LVELTLDDQYKTGLNFTSNSANKNDNLSNDSTSTSFPFGISSLTSGFFSVGLSKKGDTNIDAAINLFAKFGQTQIVSRPILNVVNNQKAVLSFAYDKVYFEIKPTIQNQFTAVGTVANPTNPIIVNSTIKSVPVGIILVLQAVANPDTNEVTLNVRPSLSSANDADSVEDPAATFLNNYNTGTTTSKTSISNKVPVVKKKELDSVMKIQSGGIMILGGFNEEVIEDTETGIPFLMNIPALGYLFKSKTRTKKNVETIIFVKAKIIPSNATQVLSTNERAFYDIFS
jgi:general secretion pathway protein D